MPRKFFVGGNFKMYVVSPTLDSTPHITTNKLLPSSTSSRNGTVQSITQIISNLNSAKLDPNTEVVISPPAIYLVLARELANGHISVSAQNVFDKPNGAFTGELSVDQLKDAKINWTLAGHSERRVILREDDDVCWIFFCTVFSV